MKSTTEIRDIPEVIAQRISLDSAEVATSNRIAAATQWQLIWWRFRKHRVAVVAGVVIVLLYLIAILANFLAYSDPNATSSSRSLIPPQAIHLFNRGRLAPYVDEVSGYRDPATFKLVYKDNPNKRYYLRFFAPGFRYRFLGLFPTDIHLLALSGGGAENHLFLLGTDSLGRDLFSRLMIGTRTSMSIGLVGVGISLILGLILGGISGLRGGLVDNIIQRIIEILRSIPTIPLWMGLAAAVPKTWSVTQVYFTITIIISLIGWTRLARVVRGRFLTLREEDFVVAAELSGATQSRIILRHLIPSMLSYIIAATTLALPAMIISETSLSFLGLGLRPPAISWGVLLQGAQNLQSIALSPWLLVPGLFVVLAILAFNFLGDGLRDAADPYGN